MDVQNISAWLFIASTLLNIYLGFRLAKFENSMNKYIDNRVESAKKEIERNARIARNDLRDELLRDIDQTNKRIDRIKNGD